MLLRTVNAPEDIRGQQRLSAIGSKVLEDLRRVHFAPERRLSLPVFLEVSIGLCHAISEVLLSVSDLFPPCVPPETIRRKPTLLPSIYFSLGVLCVRIAWHFPLRWTCFTLAVSSSLRARACCCCCSETDSWTECHAWKHSTLQLLPVLQAVLRYH